MGTPGNDNLFFQGTLGQLTTTLINAYSGEAVFVDDEFNINNTTYDGGEGTDTLLMSNFGDALFLSSLSASQNDNTGIQVVQNIELFIAGNGGDIIDLSSTDIILGDVTISGGGGDDILWGNFGNDRILGSSGNDIIDGGPGNDTLEGQGDNDIVTGGDGDDYITGGDGDDELYGDSTLGLTELDKDFEDGLTFPDLVEGTDIRDLLPSGEIGFGVSSDNLTVDFDATASITFRDGFAGYKNTLGIYKIETDGSISNASVLWGNVKTASVNIEHQIDLPVDADGGEFGFFIISNGYNHNGGYSGLDITGEGNISFVYDYGGAEERAATVNDDGNLISVVYDDGTTTQLLSGPHYHTTPRDGSNIINSDGETHAISGIIEDGNDNILRIGFEDLTNLGDADFEDVLFDLDVNTVQVDTSEVGQDTLIGGAGNDILYGEAGDDILVVGEGTDEIRGGSGSDTIVYDFLDAATDTIIGFETGAGGDILNITDILVDYDPLEDAIADFVQLSANGDNTDILIDADGTGGDFVTIATIEGGISDTLTDLMNNGNLVADTSVVV